MRKISTMVIAAAFALSSAARAGDGKPPDATVQDLMTKAVAGAGSKEVRMYSRNVNFKLRAKSAQEFTRIFELEIIPLLRRQKGFEDEISFIANNLGPAITSATKTPS